MLKSNIALLVVNFGGPRSLEEVLDFLQALLTDDAIIQTPFPRRLQHMFFRRVAYKRAKKVRDDYTLIGGKSPIFEDTEWFAKKMEEKLQIRTLAFHRYLEKTHHAFLSSMEMLDVDKFCVFPLFPQFSKATTGSIMDWLSTHLPTSTVQKLCWIHSYSTHPGYIRAFVQTVQDFLQEKSLQEEEIVLLFSAHGLPEKFIRQGDPYQRECEASFHAIASHFPKSICLLMYQSKFGRGKWLHPATLDAVIHPDRWMQGRKQVVFLPLSFTSDHIETLYEVEHEYVTPLQKKGILAYRCPALGRRMDWIEEASKIVLSSCEESKEKSLESVKD